MITIKFRDKWFCGTDDARLQKIFFSVMNTYCYFLNRRLSFSQDCFALTLELMNIESLSWSYRCNSARQLVTLQTIIQIE